METPAETFSRDEFSLTRWSADAGPVQAAVSGSGAHLADWVPWAVGGYSDEDAAAFLRLTHENWETGRAYEWAIRVDGSLAGAVGVMTRDGGVEIGYWLGFSLVRKEPARPGDRPPACVGVKQVWRKERP
ncbi:GNAT family N-acetyltransferase [Amycolatopsis sp. NPDC051371]|uniref:GNAT family N-acetyltransferase n=1 Tax=Amycolatopsis sp. NPDC051371 TaxID=3155800 RepID=UPI00342DEDED